MNELFLALLAPAPVAVPIHLGGGDLEVIRLLAERRDLFMLFQKRLGENKKVIEPAGEVDNFLEELKGARFSAIARSVRQENIQLEVSALLNKSGIPSAVMRGRAIAREIYHEPYYRISADIDLLIRRSDVLSADTALLSSGYHRQDTLPLKFWLNRIHHAVYVHHGTLSLIEIHWNFGVPSYFKLTSEEIWSEIVQGDDGQNKFSPEMTVIQLLIHHHMHAFRELKNLVDLLWAFHEYDGTIEWKTLVWRLRDIGLVKTTLITLNQLRNIWRNLSERMVSTTTLRRCLSEMDYRTPNYLTAYFSMNTARDYKFQSFKDAVMSRLALDSAGTIWFSFAKSLFPMPADIKELYSDSRSWMLPLNYSRFISRRLAAWRR
jgi:Uncharacterised nucleotidyltransferase